MEGVLLFSRFPQSESDGKNDKTWGLWRTDEYTSIKNLKLKLVMEVPCQMAQAQP